MSGGYDVVVPTIGRPSLATLLASLAAAEGPLPDAVVVVDDRRDRSSPLALDRFARDGDLGRRIVVVAGPAAGPASARNRGWRRTRAPWVAFLDDDVVVDGTWRRDLVRDLAVCGAACAGTQGIVIVPLDPSRAPTDWERNVSGLQGARYITADFAFRRAALERTGGFDERFPRAYREDAEFALRLLAAGWTLATGRRTVRHPVRPADPWVSVRLQAGNADDVLIGALHGQRWFARADAERGCFAEHAWTVATAAGALALGAVALLRVLAFAWRRIAPGPRDRRELTAMVLTSVAIPFAAVYHRVVATFGLRRLLRRPARRAGAVLFDRDGTLLEDDPDLRDPAALRFVAGAEDALARLHEAGVPVGIVTNQPRVAAGRLSRAELAAVNARIDELAGPFGAIEACEHAPDAGCACRKPAPGLVLAAAKKLGVAPEACVVVGDIGSDIAAAHAAGARAILVPTTATLAAEVRGASVVAHDLREAVDLILSGAV